NLPEGLVGMPQLRNWLILDMGDDVPMKWFQSLDRGDFGFPVTQPWFFHDDYEVGVPRNVQERMRTARVEDLTTLIITTIHPGGERVTGNLLAPLVIDSETRRGAQLTLDDGRYTMRQEINYMKFGLAVQSDASDNAPADAPAARALAGAGSEAASPTPEPAGV
ncbi:MAG TPA: flagellar assembly protein FliW, partial [Candidatus Krumholzibacteria bacterium]|nr:flagellar assembly protein FliW [Candidatus Krumholzibacteria bacterium]